MLHGQLHYRCAIDLEALRSESDNWKALIKSVRKWVARVARVDPFELAKPWFYTGDRWKQGCPKGIFLETCQAKLELESDVPKYWACRLENPCAEHTSCIWRTDISISSISPKKFRLTLINQRSVRENHLGEEPSAPSPSVPSVIRNLLNEKSWKCCAGSEFLSFAPIPARVGFLDLFKKELENPERKCPLVYVSMGTQSGRPLINVEYLARCLAGTAVVYVAQNSEADKEIEALFEKDFQCWGGMLRIYMPNVRFDIPKDAYRHRYFTTEKIQSQGAEEVILQIVRLCCRRASLIRPGDVASIDDVKSWKRMQRFRELVGQNKADENELSELIRSVEEENEHYKTKIDEISEKNDLLQLEKDELEDEKRKLEYEFSNYKGSIDEVYEKCKQNEEKLQVIKGLSKWPKSLDEVLKSISRLHAGRIHVLSEAHESAAAAYFDSNSLGTAWECLWAIAENLYELFFSSDETVDIAKIFKDETGFELALREGRQTNKNPKYARIRKREYKGQSIDITPHVKWGTKKNKVLRIHFCVDHENRCLVIGHCGGHLDNYSTQSCK